MTRYDVIYGPDNSIAIEPHFCREWDDTGGCYGTNPDHGFSWEEAKNQVILHYERQIEFWSKLEEDKE